MASDLVLQPGFHHISNLLEGNRYTSDILNNFNRAFHLLRHSEDLDMTNQWRIYLKTHSQQVNKYALKLARVMGLSPKRIARLEEACLYHDIGKSALPQEILNCDHCLEDSKLKVLQMHPVIGAELVALIHADIELVQIIQHHHERWDGTGYPSGLSGDAIPLEAQILAVANNYDILIHSTPYKTTQITPQQAMRLLLKGAGTKFNPELISSFKQVVAHESPEIAKKSNLGLADEKLHQWRLLQKRKRKWFNVSAHTIRYTWDKSRNTNLDIPSYHKEDNVLKQAVAYERIAIDT